MLVESFASRLADPTYSLRYYISRILEVIRNLIVIVR
jgi:hypothetical protein